MSDMSDEYIERLREARDVTDGFPWDVECYKREANDLLTSRMLWDSDVWMAARQFLDAQEVLEAAHEAISDVMGCLDPGPPPKLVDVSGALEAAEMWMGKYGRTVREMIE